MLMFIVNVDPTVINGIDGVASRGELADCIEALIKAGFAMNGQCGVRVDVQPMYDK